MRKGGRKRAVLRPFSVRQRIWDAMHIYPRFTMSELAAIAGCSPKTVQDYVPRLLRGEYLRIVAALNRGARRAAVYELVRRTGPHAPRIHDDGSIGDPNLAEAKSAKEKSA